MLYLQTITPALLKIIRSISASPFFQAFRLVGGTGLSLQLGHRMSELIFAVTKTHTPHQHSPIGGGLWWFLKGNIGTHPLC
jgi:hypothetical protein